MDNEFIEEELDRYEFPLSDESRGRLGARYNLDDVDLATVGRRELCEILCSD